MAPNFIFEHRNELIFFDEEKIQEKQNDLKQFGMWRHHYIGSIESIDNEPRDYGNIVHLYWNETHSCAVLELIYSATAYFIPSNGPVSLLNVLTFMGIQEGIMSAALDSYAPITELVRGFHLNVYQTPAIYEKHVSIQTTSDDMIPITSNA
jgi:hypothetical protein